MVQRRNFVSLSHQQCCTETTTAQFTLEKSSIVHIFQSSFIRSSTVRWGTRYFKKSAEGANQSLPQDAQCFDDLTLTSNFFGATKRGLGSYPFGVRRLYGIQPRLGNLNRGRKTRKLHTKMLTGGDLPRPNWKQSCWWWSPGTRWSWIISQLLRLTVYYYHEETASRIDLPRSQHSLNGAASENWNFFSLLAELSSICRWYTSYWAIFSVLRLFGPMWKFPQKQGTEPVIARKSIYISSKLIAMRSEIIPKECDDCPGKGYHRCL